MNDAGALLRQAGSQSRALATALLLSTVLGVPLLSVAMAMTLGAMNVSPGPAALFGVGVGVPMLLFVIITIFRSLSALGGLSTAALHGDVVAVTPPARSALRWVFRSDIRTMALYLLGLTAEARGELAVAAELFARAERALPKSLGASTRGRVGALIAAHLALCLAATGSREGAHHALVRAHRFLTLTPGVLDAFDQLSAGLGSLHRLEPGRDPRALAALAGMYVAYANGAHRDGLDLATRERHLLDRGLIPRERRLAYTLELRGRAALEGGGAMRQPEELPDTTEEGQWAARAMASR